MIKTAEMDFLENKPPSVNLQEKVNLRLIKMQTWQQRQIKVFFFPLVVKSCKKQILYTNKLYVCVHTTRSDKSRQAH